MALRVAELFAGVGGFKLGLEASGEYQVTWFNQWEPATKVQHAYDCYVQNFHPNDVVPTTCNMDVGQVPSDAIPQHDLLVGGFPCQDYSVAATLDKSKGLQGKKGVLWWEIRRILDAKRPPFVLLENVDRLLRSPASQRGRDFAILLACMRDLGYLVEWRVINAADYGFPQKRRRVFIFGVHESNDLHRTLAGAVGEPGYLTKSGFFAGEFATREQAVGDAMVEPPSVTLPDDVQEISDSFDFHFLNAGVMRAGQVWTKKVEAQAEPIATLAGVLTPCEDERFFIPEDKLEGPKSWTYFRSAKNEWRTAKNGHRYKYTEGSMAFPDPSNQPARTLLTGEGGTGPSRSKHAVVDPGNGRIRTLTPEECEKLNGFQVGHTAMIPDRWRYFTMGNALVVGVVERIGKRLSALVGDSNTNREKMPVKERTR